MRKRRSDRALKTRAGEKISLFADVRWPIAVNINSIVFHTLFKDVVITKAPLQAVQTINISTGSAFMF